MATGLKYYFGIDFGTTNSATVGYVVMDQKPEAVKYGDEEGRPVPSVIAIDKTTGAVFTGRDAWDKKMELSESCEYISSVKTILDSEQIKTIAGREWTAVDVASEVFKHLKANLLRGDFQFVPSMKDAVERTVKELCALTAEQYEVLESLFENPRTMISGVAGAGKTLIAMEQARRAYWEGKSVLYLCFNHSIAQYVQHQFEKDNVYIEAVTLHAFMMHTCGIEWSPDLSQYFYEEELPATFMAVENVPAYDLVIIDEGQDLLTDTYMECIDRVVQDGLSDGTWAIYYDPNQNIFNSYAQLDTMIKKLRKEAYAMSWKLHANCRNTKQIANANILMTNIPNQGKPTVSGPQVEYDSYNGKDDERRKINAIVRKIKDSGAIGSDFIILSRYTLANPLNGLELTGLDKDLGTLKTTGPLWKAKKNDVRFSTISGFKGLESKIVIMIDVDHFSDEETRLLNYVAVSRACAMLYVLYDCNAEQERQNMILSGFTQVGT